ncbi:hypothetical protein [Pleionea mediterranea]|uniref:Uncharacterized protein n=1 Tax=Pleionea mediterranea TaxID=523701 RepID=A0A316G2E7_9GAMM|nr:hypothetical protein [Pleionea mediterranea]PWK53970.1 hypothetical protein C8D97_102362 [Pleionea mediterranea]
MKCLALLITLSIMEPLFAEDNYIYFSVDRFKAPSYSIKASNGRAIVLRYSGGLGLSDPQSDWCEGKYSEHQLDILLKSLRLAKVRNWKSRYKKEGMKDGTWWKLKIINGNFNFSSSGSNEYPDNFTDVVTLIKTIEESLNCESHS